MSATNSGPIIANVSGHYSYSGSALIPLSYHRMGDAPSDFYVYFAANLQDLFREGAGTTALPTLFQNYKIDKVTMI